MVLSKQLFDRGGVKIGKRILVALITLVVLSAGVGFVTYTYLTGSLRGASTSRLDLKPQYLYSITGGGKDALKGPLSAVSGDDTVLVTDAANMKIVLFDMNGTVKTSFKPVPEVQSSNPLMTAVDPQGRFYVTVTVGSVNKIMVYDRAGEMLYAFPDGLTKGFNAPADLNKPLGLYVRGDLLYVTDIGDHNVKVFDVNGKLVRKFGGRGRNPGQFSFPNGVAASANGKIYVSDSNNARVQVFDDQGRYLGTLGAQNGQRVFSLPRGLAIDPLGRLHVVDVFNHKVFVFGPQDELLFSYGEEGGGVADFYYPNGIAIDEDG
ncbi:MAG: NHL repeat-containing protein, partial [Candidatus Aquicultorales bacterium]